MGVLTLLSPFSSLNFPLHRCLPLLFQKSVASNSGSVDGVLSTYTGGSQGAQTVASMHSLSNSNSNGNGNNSDLVARVMTPPLVSGQRIKPAATGDNCSKFSFRGKFHFRQILVLVFLFL